MKVKVINRSAYGLPHETGQGLDVRANITESTDTPGPLSVHWCRPTYVELPEGYEMQVRPAAVWRQARAFAGQFAGTVDPITAVRSR